MKRRTVFFSPEAHADLRLIYDIVFEAAGPSTATRYLHRLADFCQSLELASERGTQRDDIRKGLRVIGFERRIALAFVVEPERVVVLRLFYRGYDWTDAFT